MWPPTPVNPDLQQEGPVGIIEGEVVLGVLQGLQQPVQGPGTVVCQHDDPERGITLHSGKSRGSKSQEYKI